MHSSPDELATLLRNYLEAVLRERRALLPRVSGNFGIHVTDTGTWTVVTSGSQIGVHEGLLDVPITFALRCRAELLEALFETGDLDLQGEITAGHAELVGDVQVFARFVALGARQSPLSIR